MTKQNKTKQNKTNRKRAQGPRARIGGRIDQLRIYAGQSNSHYYLSPKAHQTLHWHWKHQPVFEAGSSVYWFEQLSLDTIRFFSFLSINISCCYCYLLFCLFNLELGLSSIRFRKQNYIPRLGTSQIQIASHRLHKVILHCSCGYT